MMPAPRPPRCLLGSLRRPRLRGRGRRRRRSRARAPAALGLAALTALAALPEPGARAQELPGPGREAPGLAELALLWAQGDYRAPIVCEIDGEAMQALRRIRIGRGPRKIPEPTDRVIFYDLEAPPETRCVAPTGGAEPNVIGQLLIGFDGRSRADTAQRDFRAALRREDGFRFPIEAGTLRVGPPGGELETHDLAGGSLRITRAARGSDAFRRLAEFPGARKMRLEIEGPEDLRLAFDLFQPGP